MNKQKLILTLTFFNLKTSYPQYLYITQFWSLNMYVIVPQRRSNSDLRSTSGFRKNKVLIVGCKGSFPKHEQTNIREAPKKVFKK